MAESAKTATDIARAEVFERLFALYDIAYDQIVDGHFPTLSWPTLEPTKSALPVAACILGAHPFSAGPYRDASGLAFHTDLGSAVRHGLYELLERHYCAKSWYGNEPLVAWPKNIALPGPASATFYSLAQHSGLPFVIAVVATSSGRFAGAGAAVRESFEAARQHALDEACLLYDGFLEGDGGVCASSRIRVLSLRNKVLSRERLKYLTSRCNGTLTSTPSIPNEVDTTTLQREVSELGEVRIGVLRRSHFGISVRVVAEGLLDLKSCRRHRGSIPDDFFC